MNHTQLAPASSFKRCAAYLIDLLIILIPAGVSLWFIQAHLFKPLPLVGWLTLSAVELITLAYTLILAAQNASTGQTVGKRLLGIRTLRAESLKPGDFSDAYARGFSFFIGLLGLGIAPLRMLLKNRKQPESESWPHRSGNTRVLDIRSGKDPLNVEKKFYPAYPEEWAAPSPGPSAIYPPVAPAWSAAYQEPPTVKPLTAARRTESNHQEVAKKRRQAGHWKAAGQGLLTLLTAVGTIAAVVFAAHALNPQMPTPHDEHEVLASSLSQKLPISGYNGQGFPGYSTEAEWKYSVSPQAKVFSTSQNVFSFDNRTLSILSTETGKEMTKVPLKESVEVSAQTTYGGQPGIYWSIGDTAYGWKNSTGKKEPFSDKIPAGAQPYAAGSELLFASKDKAKDQYKAWRFTEKGFQEMTVPAGFIPGSVSGENLLSYTSAGDIKLTGKDGQEISAYPLSSPKDSLPFAGIVSTGDQRTVALWSPYPDSTADSTPVVIAFYAADTGNLLSYIETTRERISAYPELTWGPDGTTAMYAGYLFDVESGKATVDLLAQETKPISVIGEGALGESTLGNVYVTSSQVSSISGVSPLLANQDMAIVKTHSNSIEKYAK